MLLDTIQDDLKTAMIAKDEAKVSTLRMLISAIRYTGNGRDQEFPDDQVISVIQKELKKRKEAAEGFRQGGREQLALKEEQEAELLSTYLPEQISDEELLTIVSQAISEVGATSMTDMGKIMPLVMPKVTGRADGGRISAMVKELLSSTFSSENNG